MQSRKMIRKTSAAMLMGILLTLLLSVPVFSADGTIDVVADETVNGSVELTPGFIGGVIDIGGQNVNRFDLVATGGDFQAKAYPSDEGEYGITVNVPEGGSLDYAVTSMAWLDNWNTRLYFRDRTTVVEAGKLSQLNLIINSGYIAGSIDAPNCGVSGGEIWAILDSDSYFSRAYTKFGADGRFRFPIQPNSSIRVYGKVQLTSGEVVSLEDKYVDVSPAMETPVTWEIRCGAGQLGAIQHDVDYHFDMDYHYSYLYHQGASSPHETAHHAGSYLFDLLAPGDWRLYTYSYWNGGQNLIAKYFYDISVPAGDPINVTIDTYLGFLNGTFNLNGTHTIQDTRYAYVYGYGRNSIYPSHMTTSRSRIASEDGTYALALPQGEWDVYLSTFSFYQNDPAEPFLNSYLYMYDYSRRGDTLFMDTAEVRSGHDVTYETGSATIKYSRSDGGAFTRPYVYAKCYNYDENDQLKEYIYSTSYGTTNDETVTFVGFPGTYDVEAWAYVDSSLTMFGKVAVEIVPGVDKVIDIGGPKLTVTSPAAGAVFEVDALTVSGTATDDSGVKSVTVNGYVADLISTDNPEDVNEVTFSVEIIIEEGANSIETVAMDLSGNTSSDNRKVVYELPEATQMILDVDIKPGSCKNPFNVRSKGVLPVVIMGSDSMDVTHIDPASIQLGGIAPLRFSIEDAATSVNTDNHSTSEAVCENDTADGFDDLTLKFDSQELVSVLGPVADGRVVLLTLKGMTIDGAAITGEDSITILKKGKKGKKGKRGKKAKKGKKGKKGKK